MVADLLTGHNTPRRHLYTMGLAVRFVGGEDVRNQSLSTIWDFEFSSRGTKGLVKG